MEDRKELVIASMNFMAAVSSHYGVDKSIEVWEKLSELIDPKLKGEVFFAMLDKNAIRPILRLKKLGAYDRVEAVRAIREFEIGRPGLREAINIADALEKGDEVELEVNDLPRAAQEFRRLNLKR